MGTQTCFVNHIILDISRSPAHFCLEDAAHRAAEARHEHRVLGRVEPLEDNVHLGLVCPWPIDRRLHEGAGRELAAHRRDLILGIRNLPLAVIPLHG